MMKKKLTALVAVLLVCLLLFPRPACRYHRNGGKHRESRWI